MCICDTPIKNCVKTANNLCLECAIGYKLNDNGTLYVI